MGLAFKPNSIILRRSPMPFVMTGPGGHADAVLIRSDSAPIDLLGFAAVGKGDDQSRRDGSLVEFFIWSVVLLRPAKKMWLVEATVGHDASRDNDSRTVLYRFCWQAEGTTDSVERVELEFKRRIADIVIALRSNDKAAIEWSISPLIYLCRRVAVRREKWRSLVAFMAFVYLALFAAFLIYSLLHGKS